MKITLTSLIALLASTVALAETPATTSTSASSLLKNRKFEESGTLTDSKLKADDGSLSRYSMKASLGYYGPVIDNLSKADQPNPDGAVGNYAQKISGSVMTRYRIDSDTAISGGTGIKIIHPFHGWTATEVNSPFLSYDRSIRMGDVQMRLSPGVSWATDPAYTRTGEIGGVSFDESLVWNVNKSKFALSLDSGISWWVYERAYQKKTKTQKGDGKAQEYSLGIYPGAKYNINDKMSVYGSYAIQWYNPRSLTHEKTALWTRAPSARLGMSFAFGRKAYFAPYINTYTREPFGKATTINFSTTFSVL